MALPSYLAKLIESMPMQTEIEESLVGTMTRRLERNLRTLERLFGSECSRGCYKHLIDCLSKSREATCLDEYEEWVERCIRARLGRILTEGEDELIGELLNQITGITETLLNAAGVELIEEEEPEENPV